MAKKNNYPTCVLYDDTNNCGLTYEDYVEECELNEIEPKDEGSDAYYEWLADTMRMYLDDLFLNLSFVKTNKIVIEGSLGRWNGNHDIVPVVVDDIEEAIRKCCNSADYARIVLEEGVLHIDAYHHDGTNGFTIRELSSRGEEYYYRHDEIDPNIIGMTRKFKGYLY